MADFTPTYTQVLPRPPFRFWAQKVLPTVYDDSLSYYELLTKVVDYLNQNVDDINNLNTNVQNIYDSYVLLQDWVNNYIDNEMPALVRQKLDEMAEDGTLTNLISLYIDPLIEAQNVTIADNFASQNARITAEFETQNTTIRTSIGEQNTNIAVLDARVSEFLADHTGEASVDTEVADIRVANTGITYTTAGDSVREQVNNLQNIIGLELPLVRATDFEQGSLTTNGRNDFDDSERHDYRIRSAGFYKVEVGRYYKVSIESENPIQYSVSWYTAPDHHENRTGSTGVFYDSGSVFRVTDETSPYIRFLMRWGSDWDTTEMSPADMTGIKVETLNGDINERLVALETADSETDRIIGITLPTVLKSEFEQGSLTSNGRNDFTSSERHYYRIRSMGFYKLDVGRSYKLTLNADAPMQYSISYYTEPDLTVNRTGSLGSFYDSGTSFKITDETAPYIRILLRWASDWDITEISPADLDGISLELTKTVDERITDLELNIVTPSLDYVLGSDMIKRQLKVTELGTLSLYQSFCKYNGNYYSTNGDAIAVQNSSFSETNRATLDVGHGNSFQLGSNGMAYISGWDDQTVYVIDLANLTIDSTITLPTIGYTTAAIDDVNKIAYIFQRDSRPNTDAQYNFITYDYENETIISTRKINTFQAMQACDFYKDRIVVLWGSSTSEKGYRVYDTSGNTLATYHLPSISDNEPEGVCIDRDSEVLLISDVNKKIYEISLNSGDFETGTVSLAYSGFYKNKSLSILGDSISTYAGYIPSGNANFYTGSNCGVNSVNDTWWKKVINAFGMSLKMNNSWSGSRVTTTGGNDSAGCMSRCQNLGSNPDVIIVYMGINDFNNEVGLGTYDGNGAFPETTTTFREAYAIMLNKIMTAYKSSEIWVCTLPPCERNGDVGAPEKNGNNVLLNDFNEAIRNLANVFGAKILELAKCGLTYQNMNLYMGDFNTSTSAGLHPNANGHTKIANNNIWQMDSSCTTRY